MKNKISIFKIFNYTFFILFSIITLYPFWYTFVQSIIPFSEFAKSTFLIIPTKFTSAAYMKVFSNNTFPNAFKITFFVTVVGGVLSLFFTSITAYALSRRYLPGRMFFFTLIIFTMLFSGGLIPLYITLSKIHLINNVLVYIFNQLFINTFYLIIMKTYFQSIPSSLEEAAKIDGCNDIAIFFRIIIPTSLPILATIGLFYAVDKWNTLFTAIFFINDSKKYTLQAVLYNMITSTDPSADNVFVGEGAVLNEQVKAASIAITTVPILIIYPFLQKYFVKGVMIGAIKG